MKKLPKLGRKQKVFSQLIVLCIAGAAFFMRDVIEANWNYNSVYAAAKAEGAIITADDLRKRYGAKDEENAAPILQVAIDRWNTIPKAKQESIGDVVRDSLSYDGIRFYSNRKKDRISLTEALKITDWVMADIQSSMRKSSCDFKYKWELGSALSFPELAPLRLMCRALSVQGRSLAHSGHTQEAVAKFKLALHLGDLIADTPAIFPKLFKFRIDEELFREMSSAAKNRPKDAQLRLLLRTLAIDSQKPFGARAAFDGLLFSIRTMAKEPPSVLEPHASIPGVQRSWRTRALESCIRIHRATKDLPEDPILLGEALSQTKEDPLADQPGLSNTWNAILMPAYWQVGVRILEDIANRELLLASLDVLDERQRLGHWPSTLPVDRRDPFGSGSLRYRVDGEHARIWSIGKDHKDSGGKTKKEDKESDDLVVRL